MTPNGMINDFIGVSNDGLPLANFPRGQDVRIGRNLLNHDVRSENITMYTKAIRDAGGTGCDSPLEIRTFERERSSHADRSEQPENPESGTFFRLLRMREVEESVFPSNYLMFGCTTRHFTDPSVEMPRCVRAVTVAAEDRWRDWQRRRNILKFTRNREYFGVGRQTINTAHGVFCVTRPSISVSKRLATSSSDASGKTQWLTDPRGRTTITSIG
ncbi:hypothetical protein EDD16DRAFT_1521831 [Pisolithus croceorrhizus]|nr:hypothetical protein EDD16DRAFT_1521831 [Pisolithus croceorrhizus]